MIRNMNDIEDFFLTCKSERSMSNLMIRCLILKKMARAIFFIPDYKFLNINFQFGNKTWSWHSKGNHSGSLVEIDLYAERFGNFGYVIYTMERGGVRDLSYFSGSSNFVLAFISKIIKPEYEFKSQEIADLYNKIE